MKKVVKTTLLLSSLLLLSGCSFIDFSWEFLSSSSSSYFSQYSEKESSSKKESSEQPKFTDISPKDYGEITTYSNPTEKVKLKYTAYDYALNNAYNECALPSLGCPKLLVIPIWFSDSSSFIYQNYREFVRDDIYNAYFGEDSDVGWKSVSQYYQDLSLGKLTINGVVTPWYETRYSSQAITIDVSERIEREAVEWYFNNFDDTRTNYDLDKDGHLDGCIFIYAAPDDSNYIYSNPLVDDNMWAYTYWQENKSNIEKPTIMSYFFASYDFMYSSQSRARERTGHNYGGGDTSHVLIDTHTFIHETGHILGLEDYYDYSGEYCPAGSFSMQDYNVGSHEGYSVMSLGWAEPYIPTETSSYTIGDFQSTRDLILLSPNGLTSESPFDEYLLLELYTPTGLNAFDSEHQYSKRYPVGPDAVGIRLWHVDARLVYPTYQTHDSYSWSPNFDTNPYKQSNFGCHFGMSNSYDPSGYVSPLGDGYTDFNILQLIGCKTPMTTNPTYESELCASSLFYAGDTFNMSKYANYFKHSGKLNSRENLGWSFKVDEISSDDDGTYKAKITFTKE